jgi:hypothetical protein
MAFYTNPHTLTRDTWDITDDEVLRRVLNRAAEMAYNKINRYMSGIYTVPFSVVAVLPDVKDISDILTKGYALAFAKRGQVNVSEIEELKMGHDELMAIIKGTADIVGATRLSTRGAVHTMEDYSHIFDMDDSVFHFPDTDYLEDVADKRDL